MARKGVSDIVVRLVADGPMAHNALLFEVGRSYGPEEAIHCFRSQRIVKHFSAAMKSRSTTPLGPSSLSLGSQIESGRRRLARLRVQALARQGRIRQVVCHDGSIGWELCRQRE